MPEMTLAQFLVHIAGVQHNVERAEAGAMERVARIVEAEAKHELGTYQDAAGPFEAWRELSSTTKKDRIKKGFTENDPGLRSGTMRDNIDHASDSTGAVIGSNDDELVWFEVGTHKQPPRSVLGTAVIHKEDEITREIGEAYVAAIVGRGIL